jgi:hypothetical protein
MYLIDARFITKFGRPKNTVCITISIMLLFAFKGYLNWHRPSNGHIAIVFVASDSIWPLINFMHPYNTAHC